MHAMTKALLHALLITLLANTLVSCGGGDSGKGLMPSGDVTDNTIDLQGNTGNTQSYTAIVEWDIPTTRENGEELLLSEIGGYELLYQKQGETLEPAIVITDQTQYSFELTGLPAGRYEVRVAAFDTDGLYSDYSEPAQADIGL